MSALSQSELYAKPFKQHHCPTILAAYTQTISKLVYFLLQSVQEAPLAFWQDITQKGRLLRPPSRTTQAATGTSYRIKDMQQLCEAMRKSQRKYKELQLR